MLAMRSAPPHTQYDPACKSSGECVHYQPRSHQHQRHCDDPSQLPPLTSGVQMGRPGLFIGVGGLPHATPSFKGQGEQGIRQSHACCCDVRPGPHIPLFWYDGGEGWVTKYFYDHAPRNAEAQQAGVFRCQVQLPNGQLCNHEVAEDDCCKGNCCWKSCSSAPGKMRDHLMSSHAAKEPVKRQWTTELFDLDGCCEAIFCASCLGSRVVMALTGWEDTFHLWFCLFFLSQPHAVQGAAMCSRSRMVALNNIDEGCCVTCWTAFCCSICSVAQTYREVTASGVWPGSTCDNQRPTYYASIIGPARPMS